MEFKTYFFGLPKPDREELATQAGTTVKHLTNVAYGYKPLNPTVCVAIEKLTKKSVHRSQLRPDDWHLIWPELAKAKKQAA